MALSLVAVGAKVTAAITNAIIGIVNEQGRTGVIPASVAGTGVTAGTFGRVNFAATTAISVNGCFTATYDNYDISINVQSSTAPTALTFKFRAAGVDTTGTDYTTEYLVTQTSTTVAATNLVSATGFTLNIAANTTVRHLVNIQVADPAAARASMLTATTNDWGGTAATPPFTSLLAMGHALSTAYDGFTLGATGGNITGTLRVYGWNNL